MLPTKIKRKENKMDGEFPLVYDTQAGGYDADGNYYLYDDMEASNE